MLYFPFRVTGALRLAFLTAPVLALAACGGGSGDTVSQGPAPREFTSFDEARDGAPVAVDAEVRITDRLDADALDGAPREATVLFVLDGDELRRVDLRGTGADVDFDSADGTVFEGDADDVILLGTQDGSEDGILIVNPDFASLRWAHQTLGIWERNTSGSNRFGVFSAGAETAAASVPAAGSPVAVYTGEVLGWRQNNFTTAGEAVYGADLRIETDFSTIDLETSNSFTVSPGGTSSPQPLLDLEGTGTVTGSRYTGTLTRRIGSGSGDFSGRFYGPGAVETGGTLRFETLTDTVTAAFGGRR